MKEIVSKLHAVHSSRLQYETILTLWGGKPRREPIDTAHPLVRLLPLSFPFLSFLPHTLSHRSAPTPSPAFAHSTPTPASLCGSKSSRRRNRTLSSTSFTAISSTLPVRRSFCFSFSLTNRPVLLLFPALRSPHTLFIFFTDHQVRWRWTPNSLAFWDNRTSVHRVIPGGYKEKRLGTRTTVFGERPYFDPASEGREERRERLERQQTGEGQSEKTIAPVNA
jgi:sulfonate dioxygenase